MSAVTSTPIPHAPLLRHRPEWQRFLKHYTLPRVAKPSLLEKAGNGITLSFGLGPAGSGVPFHIHGGGFSEVMHGSKRWLLFPRKPSILGGALPAMASPKELPYKIDEHQTVGEWIEKVLPTLSGARTRTQNLT